MTGLPRITISPHTGGWVAVCGTCGWRLWASRRPPVDLEATNHRANCRRHRRTT